MQSFSLTTAAGLAAVVSVLALGVTSPASAHTDLTGSTPAAGARVGEVPSRVELVFTEEVSPSLGVVSLQVDGRPVGRLPLAAGAGTGQVVAQVPAVAGPGRWEVGYRVTSADGHPIAGSVAFEVLSADTVAPGPGATATPSTSPVAPPSGTAPEEEPARGAGDRPAAVLVVGGAALGLLVLTGVAVRRLRRSPGGERS